MFPFMTVANALAKATVLQPKHRQLFVLDPERCSIHRFPRVLERRMGMEGWASQRSDVLRLQDALETLVA